MSDRVDAYANAMLEVARAEGNQERIENEMHAVANAVAGSEELRSKLTDATVPVELRQGIVEDLLGTRALPTTTALVSFVVGAGRGRHLEDICNRFVELSAAERSKVVAEVRTAVPLDGDQIERLAMALSQRTGRDVSVKVTIDPSVIGGVITTIDDTVIDGSVRNRLDSLKEAI